MHATYSFLLDLPVDDKSTDLARAAMSRFVTDYASFCGENNWYQEIALVTKSGRAYQLNKKDDWRGRGEFFSMIEKVKKKDRWGWAWKFALKCVAEDMDLFDCSSFPLASHANGRCKKIDEMSFDALLRAVWEWVPAELSKAYANFCRQNPKGNYHRSTRANTFEILAECVVPPFAYPCSPEEYRAFALCDKKDGNAILFVDIHT